MPENENEIGLTIAEAAEQLRVATTTAREWAKAGKLPAQRIGRKWIVLQSTVNAVLRGEIEIS